MFVLCVINKNTVTVSGQSNDQKRIKDKRLQNYNLMKMYCNDCTHPRFIQDVDEFVSSYEKILRNVALHLSKSSSSDPLQ